MMGEEHRLHGGLGTSPNDDRVDVKRKCDDFTSLYPMDSSVTNGGLSGIGQLSSHGVHHSSGGPHGISPVTGPSLPRSLSDHTGKFNI